MQTIEAVLHLQLNVTLRRARHEDLSKLEWFGLYRHYRQLYRRTFDDQRRGTRLMLVADLNNFPIGQLFIYFADENKPDRPRRRGYLYALRVLEPFQGQGIGTRLLHEAEAILQARGYEWGVISAAKDNRRARQLYERLGYTVYAEDPGRWQYIDHEGRARVVDEPSWMLHKPLVDTLVG